MLSFSMGISTNVRVSHIILFVLTFTIMYSCLVAYKDTHLKAYNAVTLFSRAPRKFQNYFCCFRLLKDVG